jgi:hypothetical protein
LPLTIAFPQSDTNTLNSFKEKRHRAAYDGVLPSSEKELEELRVLATSLRTTLLEWIKQNRSDLI